MFTTTYNNFHFLSEIMPNENEGYEGYEGYELWVASWGGWDLVILWPWHSPRSKVQICHCVTGITMCVTCHKSVRMFRVSRRIMMCRVVSKRIQMLRDVSHISRCSPAVSCCVRMFHNVSQCEMKVTELTSDARTWCQRWGDHNGLETSCSFDSIERTTRTEWGDLLVYVPLPMELVQRARNFPQTGCVCRYRSYHQTYIQVVEPWTNDFSSTEWVLAEQRIEHNCGWCGVLRPGQGKCWEKKQLLQNANQYCWGQRWLVDVVAQRFVRMLLRSRSQP